MFGARKEENLHKSITAYSLLASTHRFTPDPSTSSAAVTWPAPISSPLSSPFVGGSRAASQTPSSAAGLEGVQGCCPARAKHLASGRTQKQLPGAPATTFLARLSLGMAQGHCSACCSPRAADRDKGSSLDRSSQQGDQRKGPAGPQSRQVRVRLGVSAFLASTSQTHSNISLFFLI